MPLETCISDYNMSGHDYRDPAVVVDISTTSILSKNNRTVESFEGVCDKEQRIKSKLHKYEGWKAQGEGS